MAQQRIGPRHRLHRAAMTLVLLGAALWLSPGHAGARTRSGVNRSLAAEDKPLFRFVSAPDFINADIGDVSTLAGWQPGDPNSTNSYWTSALDQILGDIKAENPAFVLPAGDLINGRWDQDALNTGIFGPTTTDAQRREALDTAGTFYYSALAGWLTQYGLTANAALGDHDIGDNPWPSGSFKLSTVDQHKALFAKYFTTNSTGGYRYRMHPTGPSARTAYAFRFRNSLFVSVDEFLTTTTGVRLAVDRDQRTWLAATLAQARKAGVDHIIVQGHLPIIGSKPPAIPSSHSSRLFLTAGATSQLWQLLRQYHVDLYLDGEMHALSRRDDGVVQITHGAAIGFPPETYLIGDVYPDRIAITVKQLPGQVLDDTRLWQMTGTGPPAEFTYQAPQIVRQWVIK